MERGRGWAGVHPSSIHLKYNTCIHQFSMHACQTVEIFCVHFVKGGGCMTECALEVHTFALKILLMTFCEQPLN